MLAPHSDEGYVKLADLPSVSDQDKIEVWARSDEDGSSLLELVEYSWGSGLGWYVQKRITLDAGQVDALRALLGGGSSRPNQPLVKRPAPRALRDGNVVQLVFAE